jgi:hypothetical protein
MSQQRFKLNFRNKLVVDPYGTLNSEGKFVGRLKKPSPMYVNGMPGSPNIELYPNLKSAITGEVNRYFPTEPLPGLGIPFRSR